MPASAIDHGSVRRSGAQIHAREIAGWAEAHYGLISRRKLLALGVTRDRVAGLLAAGVLLPAADGVYYVGHRSRVPGQHEALALADAGPGAALGGASATGWRGMTDPPRGPVHLLVPPARNRSSRGVVHQVWTDTDFTIVRGLACATPQRAVMDLPAPLLRQALQWLMRHAIAIEPIVERMRGRRGAKAFRAEVAQLIPQLAHTMSELEARFVRLCRRHGIPLPVVNGELAGGDLLDCVWPGHRLVVELDGRRWHEHRDREDRARDRRRMLEGRLPFRYGWADVTTRESDTAAEVRLALAAA